MKKTLIIALSLLASPGYAGGLVPEDWPQKGVEVYDPDVNAMVRYGVRCSVKMDGQGPFVYDYGLCNISRGIGEGRDRVTLIDTGPMRYKIIRDIESNFRARLLINDQPYQRVIAQDGCWVGDSIRICAD